jgi:osmotically-inducible protein OsmY
MFNFFHKKDHQIQKDVKSELNWDPSIVSDDIDVSIKDGKVTLTGTVPHFYERYSAEEAAYRVGGVRSVEDDLEVSPPDSYTRTDEQIAQAARTALDWNYQVPGGVGIKVEEGFVTLSGQVDWDYQRTAAVDAVSSLMGVLDVINEITIKPRDVDSSDVKSQIQDALKRSASVEGNSIEVTVDGDKVTLSGNLDSYADIETARIAAWNASGVMDVVNNMTLTQ